LSVRLESTSGAKHAGITGNIPKKLCVIARRQINKLPIEKIVL
jgi:hypothetical protein